MTNEPISDYAAEALTDTDWTYGIITITTLSIIKYLGGN